MVPTHSHQVINATAFNTFLSPPESIVGPALDVISPFYPPLYGADMACTVEEDSRRKRASAGSNGYLSWNVRILIYALVLYGHVHGRTLKLLLPAVLFQ